MTEPTPYERAAEGKCYKIICGKPAERFFLANVSVPDGPSFVALCRPCAEMWLAQRPGFAPVELSCEEFLNLAQVMDVTGS